MATVNQAYIKNDVFHIVFLIVLFSILIQGSLIPFISKKLDMIDEKADVMKTFSDYSDEVPVQYIQFKIPKGHFWENKSLADITLPPETLIVLIQRGKTNLVPCGQTILRCNDVLVLLAKAPAVIDGIALVEKVVDEEDELAGKSISEVSKREDTLIVMIQRKEKIIIPRGQTVLEIGDLLVINRAENLCFEETVYETC